jgi:hypothetical protein
MYKVEWEFNANSIHILIMDSYWGRSTTLHSDYSKLHHILKFLIKSNSKGSELLILHEVVVVLAKTLEKKHAKKMVTVPTF